VWYQYTVMNEYRIVVVIPTRNAQAYIGRAINSALSQNYANVRYIVVDDCSTDGTWSEIQKYRSRVELIRNPGNLGFAGTLNKALEYADDGDLYFVHQDDVALNQRDYISVATRYFDDPLVALVTGEFVDSRRSPFFKRLIARLLKNDVRDDRVTEIPYSLLKADLIRVSALRRIGGFEYAVTRSLGLEDHLLAKRLRDAGYRLIKDPGITYTLDYARCESLRSFLAKEIVAGLNLGYALPLGLIRLAHFQSMAARVRRSYRLGQVAFSSTLILGGILAVLLGRQGEIALGCILSLCVARHLYYSRGFAPVERPVYVVAALTHDFGFSCGWLIGFLLGVYTRIRRTLSTWAFGLRHNPSGSRK
jgi:glycosyltransferase EpsE